MTFDKNNPDHHDWLNSQPIFDFIGMFNRPEIRRRMYKRMLDLMHDKPMTKESIDTVIEYIRECGK